MYGKIKNSYASLQNYIGFQIKKIYNRKNISQQK